MSELKPCPTHGDIEWLRHWGCPECVKELREENQRLREITDPNPWRYPAKGELPDDRMCMVTLINGTVAPLPYFGAIVRSCKNEIRAWQYWPEPAPELEVTE